MARAPAKPSSNTEIRRQERRRRERLRKQEIEERPASASGGAAAHKGLTAWSHANITRTEGGSAFLDLTRSVVGSGGGCVLVAGEGIAIREPGWWVAVLAFTGQVRLNAAGSAADWRVEPAIYWTGYKNGNNTGDHFVSHELVLNKTLTNPTWEGLDGVVSTPPVRFAETPTGFNPEPKFSPYLYPSAEGATAEAMAFGQADASLDIDGFPSGTDVTTFAVYKVGDL